MKILANGEIVSDNDPRVQRTLSEVIPLQAPQHDDDDSNLAPATYLFNAVDRRLSSMGIPTWNIGPYPVSPTVSTGFLLSFLAMGFRGLLFSGFLFFIVNYSRGNDFPNLSTFGITRGAGSRTTYSTQNRPSQERTQNDNSHHNRAPKPNNSNTKYFTGPGHRLT